MNTAPTRQMIVAGGYDVVLAATGAKVNIPNIPGLKDENGKLKPEYMSCLDTCGKEPKLGKHVVIVGGSEVGIETAMYLCGKGHDVTVLTRQKKLAHNASGLHYITMAFVKAGPNGEARRGVRMGGLRQPHRHHRGRDRQGGGQHRYLSHGRWRAYHNRRQRCDLRRHDPADRRGLWLLRSHHRVLRHW